MRLSGHELNFTLPHLPQEKLGSRFCYRFYLIWLLLYFSLYYTVGLPHAYMYLV